MNGVIYSVTGGVKYPDGNTQTVAYLGSSQTVTAGNVSSGVFGYPSAVSNYSFRINSGVGMPTAAGLTAMLYVSSTAATTPFRVDDEVSDTTPFHNRYRGQRRHRDDGPGAKLDVRDTGASIPSLGRKELDLNLRGQMELLNSLLDM